MINKQQQKKYSYIHMSLNILKCFPASPFFFFLCNKCIVCSAWPNPSLFVWFGKKHFPAVCLIPAALKRPG